MKSLLRLIARLDIKGPNVVKGICFEGLRVVGNPATLAREYAKGGADELLYIDTVASLYGRNQLAGLLEQTTDDVFVPVTVGGGIKSRADVQRLLNSGADKVAINTAAIERPGLIDELAGYYGSQCIVASVEAKRTDRTRSGFEAFTHNGREKTGRDAVAWAQEAVQRGAGEILITSIDQEGTGRGCDLELIRAVSAWCPVPLSVGGGIDSLAHAREALECGADALAMASALHYKRLTIGELRDGLASRKLQTEE